MPTALHLKFFSLSPKLLRLVMIGAAFHSQPLAAQVVKLKALPIIAEEVNAYVPAAIGFSVEQAFKEVNSMEFSYELYYRANSWPGDGNYSGQRINLAYKRYFGAHSSYQGFLLSPHISYLATSVPEYDEPLVSLRKGASTGFGAGLNLGRQWLLGERVTLGIEAGTTFYRSYLQRKWEDSSSEAYYDNHWDYNLSFSLGVLIYKG